MKKAILLQMSFVLLSCSSIKVEEQIVRDFIIEKQIKNTSSFNPSYLISDALSNDKTLEYYEMAFLGKELSVDENKIIFGPRKSNYWPIDLNEVNTLKLVQQKDSFPYYWRNKMSKIVGMPLLERKEFSSKILKLVVPISSSGNILSKPIVSLDKKHAFFTYSIIYSSSSNTTTVYLVQKQKGKWKTKAYYFENYDYQPPSWRIKK